MDMTSDTTSLPNFFAELCAYLSKSRLSYDDRAEEQYIAILPRRRSISELGIVEEALRHMTGEAQKAFVASDVVRECLGRAIQVCDNIAAHTHDAFEKIDGLSALVRTPENPGHDVSAVEDSGDRLGTAVPRR